MIDAHHHLWDLSAVHYPWLAAKGATRFFGDPIQRQHKSYQQNERQKNGGICQLLAGQLMPLHASYAHNKSLD